MSETYIDQGLVYTLDSTNNTATLTGVDDTQPENATILSSFTKDGVNYNVELTGGAFSGNTFLETLIVPPEFTEIPDAFCFSVPGLKSITLQGSNMVIGSSAFKNSYGLTEFSFDNVKEIKDHAFYGVPIQHVDLGSNVELVWGRVFMHSSLKSIIFSSHPNFTTIPESICKSSHVESVTIPANVKRIEPGAFTFCGLLSTVTLSSNSQLEQIDGGAFQRCGLTSFTIPASVTTIGGDIFNSSGNMQEIIFEHETIPAAGIHGNAFRGLPDTCVIKHGENSYTVSEFFNSLRFTYEGFQYKFNSGNTATLVGHDGVTNPATMVPSFINSEDGVTYTVVFEGKV